jgi:dihydropteroate synthase
MKCGSHNLDFGERTFVMGILNVTPDSFSDGGLYSSTKTAIEHAKKMIENGADILDVGGESTRPGATPVSIEDELRRVIPVIAELSKLDAIISVDTYKPEVAFKAVEAGARMLNDINGLRTKGMAEFAASTRLPVVVMHMHGTPRNMQDNPAYRDVVSDINSFFDERISFAVEHGIKKERIILDPGIGFGKKLEHNLEIIRRLREFKKHGLPLLIGPSRKSFLGAILGKPPSQRLEGTIAAVTASIINGADIVRVHDVSQVVMAVRVADKLIGR